MGQDGMMMGNGNVFSFLSFTMGAFDEAPFSRMDDNKKVQKSIMKTDYCVF